MKNIAHCAFSLAAGGAERQLVTTAFGIHAQKKDITQRILCARLSTSRENHYRHTLNDTGIDIVDVSTQPIPRRTEQYINKKLYFLPSKFIHGVCRFAAALELQLPHIVHIWSDNIHAVVAASLLGVPHIVISWRSLSPVNLMHALKKNYFYVFSKGLFLKGIYRSFCLNKNVTLTSNSISGKESYANWLHIDSERISVIYNGIDINQWKRPNGAELHEFRETYHTTPDAPVLVGAMSFYAHKRPLLWLKTAEIAACYGIKSVLFGDGPLRAEMNSFIDNRPILKKHIQLPGIEKDMRKSLSIADVFLLTSAIEGLPNVLIEAQALGIPVVTADAGGAKETIIPDKTGFIVPVDADPRYIFQKIKMAMFNLEWRCAASRHLENYVQNKFSLNTMIENILKIYNI